MASIPDTNYAYGTSPSVSIPVNSGQNNANENAISAVTEVAETTITAVAKGNRQEQSNIPDNNHINNQTFNRENLDNITKALNKFIQSLNADIHFKLHDKTKELMVQVVDNSNHKVLKEFPPHQLLDTIAAIRERIGVLLDKRA